MHARWASYDKTTIPVNLFTYGGLYSPLKLFLAYIKLCGFSQWETRDFGSI